jgi:hypothetical protein
MPMDRTLYPNNWPAIATRIKTAAGWRCKQCGRGCYNPLFPSVRKPDRRLVLTVHHKDHDPQNNDPDNLEALCAPCHLKKERAWRQKKARGAQLELPGLELSW